MKNITILYLRLLCPNKGLRKQDPAQTVAEQNTTKALAPTGVLRSLAAEGGVQLQSCYVKYGVYYIILFKYFSILLF
jgi:hypothetical protein